MDGPHNLTQLQIDAFTPEQRWALLCQLAGQPDEIVDPLLFARLLGFSDVLPASAMRPENDDVDHDLPSESLDAYPRLSPLTALVTRTECPGSDHNMIAPSRLLSAQQQSDLEFLKTVKDEDVDLSDMPSITDFSTFERGPFLEVLRRRRERKLRQNDKH